MGIWHWLLTVTGTNNTSGYWYGWWSAFASDLPEFAILIVIWRKVNCHAKGCLRIGLHRVDGTPYVTCRKHHPVHPGSAPASAEQIAQAHARSHTAAEAPATAEAPAAVAEAPAAAVE